MRCPFCSTENREDREKCYHCGKDLSMLRLIANRARNHYNKALEHAERGRTFDAIGDLKAALELDSHLREAHLLLGTLYARLERPAEAREAWSQVLGVDPVTRRASEYLADLPQFERALPMARRVPMVVGGAVGLVLAFLVLTVLVAIPGSDARTLGKARNSYLAGEYGESLRLVESLPRPLASSRRESEARWLDTALEQALLREMRAFNEALAQGDLAAARSSRDRMAEWNLPRSHRATVEAFSQLLDDSAREDVARLTARPFSTVTLEEIDARIGELQAVVTDDSTLLALRDDYVARGRAELLNLLESLENKAILGSEVQPASMVRRLAGLRDEARMLGVEGRLETLVETLRSEAASVQIAQAREAIERGDGLLALESLAELADEEMAGRDAIWVLATRLASTQLLDMLRTAEREQDWDLIVSLADEEKLSAVFREMAAEAGDLVAEARRRQRLARAYELVRLRSEWSTKPLENKAAEHVVELAEGVSEGLPASVWARVGEDVLALLAEAHRVLGNESQAAELEARLAEEFPASVGLSVAVGEITSEDGE